MNQEVEKLEEVIILISRLNELGFKIPLIIPCPYCHKAKLVTTECCGGWKAYP